MTQTATFGDDEDPKPVPFVLQLGRDTASNLVSVDGVDVTNHVYGVHLTAVATGLPHVVLELYKKSTQAVEFDGLARVAVGEEPDPGPAAAKFLAAIDPEILEQAALNRLDLETGEHALTKAMLRQLTEWASGRS